jgi:predicted nucleic acid-binding protein
MPSASTVFVDTNVLLYSEDGAHKAKQRAARDWLTVLWRRRCGRVSTQVMHEFYVNATRKLQPPMSAGDARAEVRRYQRWQPWVHDQPTLETAWAVESRFGTSFWDALIVAAAMQQGCTWLLTEDLQHEQQFDGVRIVNPFLVGPEVLDAPAA